MASITGFCVGVLLGVSLLAGCGGNDCDPGWVYKDHACRQAADSETGQGGAGGEAGTEDAGTGGEADGGGAGGEVGAPCASQLGATCTQTTDCTCDTSYCAALPGSPGICTRTGCLQDESVCPSGWSCMDLSGYGVGLPSICVPD
ncbi:MAG: hypothetical protein JW940_20770 [Polyangiaceae bacterium]|nr:hypothetical protein [Polyangiaceae bacterium]